MILLILAITSVSVTATEMTCAGVSDYDSTIVSGLYTPYMGNDSLIPIGENVQITCNTSTGMIIISTSETILDSNGYYIKIVPDDVCTVGDKVQSCVDSECSEWIEINPLGDTGWGVGLADIMGVPEYTSVAVAFLMIFTGGGIAYLRNKKK